MHACGGKGRCTTCKMIVVQGMKNLTPLTQDEVKYRNLGQLAENERLACQTKALGFCLIRVPDESKMPHMGYTF
jgi:2Fe-2S ferredoxin